MAPFPASSLLLLSLVTSASARTRISFYQDVSCASDSSNSGDAFENENLPTGAGLCYRPPDGTVAINIDEIDEGCSVTAYLDSTCSMPTSPALTTSIPCYFLGPSDLIGSFKARCTASTSTTSTNDPSASATATGAAEEADNHAQHYASASASTCASASASSSATPGLQGPPSNGATALSVSSCGPLETWHVWVELGVRALMSVGAVEAAWGWGML